MRSQGNNQVVRDAFLRGTNTLEGTLAASDQARAGFRLNVLTTTQRDALTVAPVVGDLIYNSTTAAVEIYSGSAWFSFPATLSLTELGFLDGLTAGTILASKAVVVDANKDAADFRNVSGTNLKAGKDAVAGTVTVFPSTTARGKAVWDVTNQTGDTQVTYRTAAMGQATVITTPDPGGTTASVVLSEGAQTVNGVKTFGNIPVFPTGGITAGTTTLTEAELGVLDGLTPGAAAASKAVTLDANLDSTGSRHQTSSGNRLTTGSVGTAGTGCVAEEHGDGFYHVTKLTCTAVALGTGGDDADLAIGALIYTFPAGTIMVDNGSIKGILDQASHGTVTDGEIGLGTVIATGAVAVLGGTATFENILLGDNSAAIMTNYVLGTTVAEVAGCQSGGQPLAILAAGAHTVHLNAALDWPDIAAPEAATFTGVITLRWRIIS